MRFLFDPKNLEKPIVLCFPERLFLLRDLNGLHQHQIAHELNLVRSSYSYYESGRSEPSLLVLAKLSKLYDVSVDYLLGIEKVNRQLLLKDKQDRERLLLYFKNQK